VTPSTINHIVSGPPAPGHRIACFRLDGVAVVSPAREPADEAEIAAQLDRVNAAVGRDERIRRVVVARDRFTVENDLFTSQRKPRRRRILEAYREEIFAAGEGILAR
jgi:long-chain acyl-CoA synthetase